MRVSSTMMINNYMNSLNGNYDTQAKLMEQNSTQQKLNRPSDDPVDYSRYLSYTNNDVSNQQFLTNANNGISWMNATDNALVNISEHFTTVVEQTNQAANGTNQTVDNQATASQLLALLQETISQGNSELGDRYLFSGQKDKVEPFKISDEKIERGLAKTLNEGQSEFFSKTVRIAGVDTKEPGGTQVGGLNQMLNMKGSDGNTYYLDTSTGYVFSQDFVENGYKDKITAGQTTVTAADAVGRMAIPSGTSTLSELSGGSGTYPTVYADKATYDKVATDVRTNFTNLYFDKDVNGAITTAGKNLANSGSGLTVTDPSVTTEFSFNTIEQYVVNYQGDDNKISMVKLSGSTDETRDSVNVTGSDVFGDTDIFGSSHGTATLNNLLTVVAQMDGGNQKWLSSDGITVANNAKTVLQKAQTSLASRNMAYSNAVSTMEGQNTVIQGNINNVNGVNTAELATKLITAQTIYNISISMGKNVIPQSIADYLS
ncbi:flagellin [Pectinatus brassicae]|uniref:Flagellar hook-associated protein 3 FlgL n=1 Tax=Pectinatus brassicae TaxID=862415 RepID=A0A840UI81_9FIRM|nr:hypothetical protein [Pectinatus brassicae]MBB5336826.1 flagellar hook-associated protein 3 FlgL [Pectinatus brassicae]